MTATPKEHFLNAEFNLSLAREGAAEVLELEPALRQQIEELALHSWAGCDAADSVRLYHPPEMAFLEYWKGLGLHAPCATLVPDIGSGRELLPFGWNARAAELARRYAIQPQLPEVEIVKQANSKLFCSEMIHELEPGNPFPRICRGWSQIERAMRIHACEADHWMVKSEHGNASIGNRVLLPGQEERNRHRVEELLRLSPRLLLEPLHHRVVDYGCRTFLTREGTFSVPEVYELRNTRDGRYVGVHRGPRKQLIPSDILEMAQSTADLVCERLHKMGYFGPVQWDSYTHRAGGLLQYRPLVDLNARQTMATGIFRFLDRESAQPWVHWYLLPRKKFAPGLLGKYLLPEKLRWSRSGGEGILWTSPHRMVVEGEARDCRRIGVLLCGASHKKLENLDERFRAELLRG